MSGKGLFPIVESGYDVREADAYIAFLLAEYNKAMERIALLEQSQTQDKGMDDAAMERQEAQLEELKELRTRFRQFDEQLAQASAREEDLKDKLFRVRQENAALTHKVEDITTSTNPTVEHTAKIIAEILVQARDGGEKILAESNAEAERLVAAAHAEAEKIIQDAREQAHSAESDAIERAKRAKEVFAESQRKLQEAYSFLQSFPEEITI
ncbi:MAG: hypothetical protein LBJ12_03300 [Oscillospiraceae bacterium]|jgi:chromosome segregation ATPase|nr:hypothetical protein [Oscillospiraceae bacterium]